MPPEIFLAFDTAAAHCAAAVLWGDAVADPRVVRRVETWVEVMAKGQAERLVPMLGEFLGRHQVAWADLTGIAVGVGPGNFTGIRISVALARGLALGRGIAAVGVTGFEAVAPHEAIPFWAVIEAPRDQVYVQRRDGGAAMIIAADRVAGLDAPVRRLSAISSAEMVANIAEVGFFKAATVQPRPAPFYLRGADAAPPSDLPPVILP